MVQIRSGNVPVVDSKDGVDQHAKSTLERQDYLRDLAERDKKKVDDQIEQVAIAVQVMMLPQQPLVIRSKMSGVTEKSHRTGRQIPSGISMLTPAQEGVGEMMQLKARIEHMPESGFQSFHIKSRSEVGLTALIASTPTPIEAAITKHGVVAPAVTTQSEVHKTNAVAERKQVKNASEDAQQIRTDPIEKLIRDRMTTTVQPAHMRNTSVRQAVPALGANPTIHEDGSAGWIYNFRSWGKQHAVRILPSTMHLQPLMTVSSVSLQPFSALVEQRLQDHGGMMKHGDSWLLKERDEHRQQQQDSRHQPDERDEDEA